MKNFFDLSERSDISGYVTKSMIFVQKMITQNIFKIQKKFSHHVKVYDLKRYKILHSDSRNDKDMVKTKKISESGDFFLSLTVYF